MPAVIRRPLYKTLVHALREVNPQAAVTLEAAPRLRNPTRRSNAERVFRTANNVSTLAALCDDDGSTVPFLDLHRPQLSR